MSLDQIIRTMEQFNELPVGAVVGFPGISNDGLLTIYQRVQSDGFGPEWWCDGVSDPAIVNDIAAGERCILLWHPTWTISDFEYQR